MTPDSSSRSARRGWRPLAIACLALLPLGGCGSDEAAPAAADEHWYAVYTGGVRVGHQHNLIRQQQEEGRSVVHAEQQLSTSMDRQGERFDMDLTLRSVELPDGQLLQFDIGGKLGSDTIQLSGRVADGRLQIEGRSPAAIPWDPKTGGFLAIEQSLQRQPMRPGEKRTLAKLEWALVTVAVANVELAAGNYEQVRIRDADVELLPIASTEVIGGARVTSTLWTDEQGRIVKAVSLAAQQELVQCAKTEALKPLERRFDAGRTLSVPVQDAPRSLAAARRAKYRVRVRQVDPGKVFAQDVSQQVRAADPHTIELLVRAIRPDTPGVSDDSQPTGDDTAPSAYIESNDEVIVQMARATAPQERDPWRLALALERQVKGSMKPGRHSKLLSTAAEAARTLEGDCTEHAVLLAGLARARDIPARVALGMIYDESQRVFAFHMWTEVYVVDRWVGLDATRGKGGITAAYLKLSDTNLAGQSGLASLQRVADVLGQFEKLEVLEAE
jgi:Transglutaminase-like superfamily